jgi:hypothetical protein
MGIARPIAEPLVRTIGGSLANRASSGASAPYLGVIITQQPSDWSGPEGGTATFQVQATSSGTIPTYQWQENIAGTWTNRAGAATSTLSIPGVLIADNGRSFRCTVTNTTNSQQSQPASIIITGATWFIIDEFGNRTIDEPAVSNIVDERSP